MSISQRTITLQRDIEATLARITDAQVRDLVRAWAEAWDEVSVDLNATLLELLTSGDRISRAQMLRSTRLQRALAVIADQLEDLAQLAGVRIIGDLAEIIDRAGSAQASIIDSQLPPNAQQLVDLQAWSRVDAEQLEAIVRRATTQITALTKPLSAEAYAVVRRELIRGVAAGSNPRETARRMVARAERYGFNGGLQRALVIARTETLDAHRAAAEVAQAAHADVLGGWVWLASLSERTCPACLAMNGTVHALTDPGPLGHQQCSCSRMPQVKSWAELGFDGIEEPPPLLPDSEAFFNGLTPEQQKAILGPARWTAWDEGRFPMSQWATRRTTPGWRDSYVVAPPPKAGRARSVAA